MNNNLNKNEEARKGHAASELRPRNAETPWIGVGRFLVSLREIERGLTRRPRHGHAVRSGWERAIEGVLYALTEPLLVRGLVAGIAHRPATLHDQLLESGERPVDAALRDTKVWNSGTVGRVLLCVAHQFERDGPGPRDGDEGGCAH